MHDAELVEQFRRYFAVMPARAKVEEYELRGELAYRIARPISDHAWVVAVSKLQAERRIRRESKYIVAIEADRPEKELEKLIFVDLQKTEIARMFLGSATTDFRFFNTAQRRGKYTGRYSIPDFVYIARVSDGLTNNADIRLASIELKNRRGADVVAVKQASNYHIFSHYTYLLVPDCKRDRDAPHHLERDCFKDKVGLALFDLKADGRRSDVAPTNLRVKLPSPRNDAQRDQMHRFLEDRDLISEVEAWLGGAST